MLVMVGQKEFMPGQIPRSGYASALVGLNIISVFKCKRHYRKHVFRQIMEKTTDDGR